jgi:hypothetical protein
MFPGRRLHGLWVGERLFGVFFRRSFFFFFCSSSVESDLLTLAGFLKTRGLHSGRRFLSVQQPPATAVPVLHTRRMAYTRQWSLSLDPRVWVTTCLLGCSWGFFDGSKVFRRVSTAEEVFGGGAWSARAVVGDYATQRRSRCWLLF